MWRSEMGGCSYNARESSADLQVSVPPHTFCVKKFLNVTFWMCTTHYTQSSPPYSAFCNFLILFLYAYSINMTFSWPFLFLRFCWCYIGVTAFVFKDFPGSWSTSLDQHWWKDHGDHCEGSVSPTSLCPGCCPDSHLHAHEEGHPYPLKPSALISYIIFWWVLQAQANIWFAFRILMGDIWSPLYLRTPRKRLLFLSRTDSG